MAHQAERYKWILEWLDTHVSADALDTEFQEAYHQKFPEYKRRETCWGAQPVAQACRDLAALYASRQIVRRNVGLSGNWQPGFPKWVPSYSLR